MNWIGHFLSSVAVKPGIRGVEMILSTGAFTSIRTALNNPDFTNKMSPTNLSFLYFFLHRF